MKVKRICAGSYKVTHYLNSVYVTKVVYPNDGTYWIAAANWDHDLFTDPLHTKASAVLNAKYMLAAAHAEGRN